MGDETDQNNQIAMFMEISGTDFETAKQTLTANNFNLEQAINFHLERSNVLNGSDDDANESNSPMTASTSAGQIPNLPIDDDEAVRPPILPKREQMILPGEDNFRYRKRRTVASRTSVCPLRNFQLEGEIQEERLQAAVLGNFIAHDAEANEADEEDLRFASLPTAKGQTLGFAPDTKKELQSKVVSGASALRQPASRLSELFRPPVDISFCGSFQAARDYAKEQNRWLIVNVQDMNDFNCQILNRDIWSSEKLREIIKKYFIFWQVAIDNADGHRFQVFYGITVFPYIGIIDPRTGEEKLSHKNGFHKTLSEFMSELKDYLKENTAHPNTDIIDASDNGAFDDFDCPDEKTPAQTSNSHVSTPPRAKRKRLELEPSSLSEQEQIALAIGNSLREINSNGGDKSENSFGDDDEDNDDESDFEEPSDDEFSNQSFKSSTMSTKDATAAVEEKKIEAEKVEEIVTNTPETYESHLGDESDPKARIQLRLPNGDRHILEWPCTSRLKALKLYIPFKYPELTTDNPYKVICPFVGGATTNGQPSNILEMDDVLTLKEANLYPTVILHLRNED